MDYRAKIIEELGVLQKKENQERNVFKARAYGKVIANIKGMEKPITQLEDVDNIPGVGEKIRMKIQEIINTGSLEAARKVKQDVGRKMIDQLMNIYGVGPVKAKSLMEEYPEMKSIEDLRKAVDQKGSILNDKQKIGLKYYEDLLERIPRKEMFSHEKAIHKQLKAPLHHDIVGSFRRGAEDSGDIDALIGYPSTLPEKEAQKMFKEFVQSLIECGYIIEVLALGPKKCMAICRVGAEGKARRLDLLLTNAKEYPFALLYFTGSDKFNIQFRKRAVEKGYTLNEHELKRVKDNAQPVPFMEKEEDVFAFLDIPYVPPEKRVNNLRL